MRVIAIIAVTAIHTIIYQSTRANRNVTRSRHGRQPAGTFGCAILLCYFRILLGSKGHQAARGLQTNAGYG